MLTMGVVTHTFPWSLANQHFQSDEFIYEERPESFPYFHVFQIHSTHL